MPELHIWHIRNITLEKALTAAPELTGGVILLYTPQRCLIGHLVVATGVRIYDNEAEHTISSLDGVYEARCFTATAELRWLNDARGSGRAAMITEEETHPNDWTDTPIDTCGQIAHAYQVWGKGTGVTHEAPWGSVSAGRIGTLYLPCGKVGEKETVVLTAVEYLSTDYPDGNCAVIEERLTGLEVQ